MVLHYPNGDDSSRRDRFNERSHADDHTDLDKANEDRAKEEERYREEVSRGGHGAHRPCEKFPIEEAREEDLAP